MILIKNTLNHQPLLIERVLVFVMAVAVFTWKPGMYIVPGALFLYFVIRVVQDSAYRAAFLSSRVAKFSLVLFALGILCVLVSVTNLKEVLWFARKGLCLLMVPPLLLAFRHHTNRQAAFWGLLLGFWVNVVVVAIFVLQNPSHLSGGRIEGIWYLGPWDALLGLFIAFLLPKLSGTEISVPRPLIYVTFVAALALLVLSGGRAPWVATALILVGYMVFFYRKALLLSVVSVALVGALFVQLFPTQLEPKLQRISSIADTEDSGNWVRLTLWSLGIDHLKFYAQHEPLKLIAGAGPNTYLEEQKVFFTKQDYPAAQKERLISYGYPTGDTHNMYLDAMLRMGVIWFGLFLAWLVALAYLPVGNSSTKKCSAKQRLAPFLILGSYAIVGLFYTTVLSFVTFFIIFFLTLTASTSKHP